MRSSPPKPPPFLPENPMSPRILELLLVPDHTTVGKSTGGGAIPFILVNRTETDFVF